MGHPSVAVISRLMPRHVASLVIVGLPGQHVVLHDPVLGQKARVCVSAGLAYDRYTHDDLSNSSYCLATLPRYMVSWVSPPVKGTTGMSIWSLPNVADAEVQNFPFMTGETGAGVVLPHMTQLFSGNKYIPPVKSGTTTAPSLHHPFSAYVEQGHPFSAFFHPGVSNASGNNIHTRPIA